MILVTLGTQKQSFIRLLKMIDKCIENGTITDKVIVQAGHTKYDTKNMEIFDFVSISELDKLVSECDLLITHGGVGSIMTALRKGKKVIAVARLFKYKEHVNDHQLQIVNEFSNKNYILNADENNFEEVVKKAKNFKPSPFKSKADDIIRLINNYINNL